ncbi:MAG: signal peptidase II [Candidatus Omnitrophica bacterium]|nr:signal peptidase II [Candidatus Omnitrophota bacterium]
MKKRLFFLIVPSVFILDRLTKAQIIRAFAEGQSRAVWPGVFHLTRVNNTGAAFGILKGAAPFLMGVTWACAVLLAVYLFWSGVKKRERLWSLDGVAWALVLAGALGNGFDRWRYGYVVDFLDFRVWPVFNVADAAISVGVFLILLKFLTGRRS